MKRIFILIFCMATFLTASPQTFVPNYDEQKVPGYQLPEIFTFENGETVKTPDDWEKRRPEITRLFAEHVYGHAPKWDGKIALTLLGENKKALDGASHMREFKVSLIKEGRALDIYLLLYLPVSNPGAPIAWYHRVSCKKRRTQYNTL